MNEALPARLAGAIAIACVAAEVARLARARAAWLPRAPLSRYWISPGQDLVGQRGW
jgi:hypothetical protein